jgi:hypothetical protein
MLLGVALHQDVARATLALSASAAGPNGHKKFLVGVCQDFGSGAEALKRATLRSALVHKSAPKD